MKTLHISLSLALFIFCLRIASGQGFVNLDFEQATINPNPHTFTYPLDPAEGFPGWTVDGSGTVVSYNGLSIGAPAVTLMGPDPSGRNPGFTPLQGSYSVFLVYFNIAGPPPTLSQSGLIPTGTRSVSFLVDGSHGDDAVVTLNGIVIPLVSVSGGRLAGDVSAYAGRVAQLTFSTTTGNINDSEFLYFDDVQFSPSQVPEPSIFGMMIFGVVLFLIWKGMGSRAMLPRWSHADLKAIRIEASRFQPKSLRASTRRFRPTHGEMN
jgi:hypothetical protein